MNIPINNADFDEAALAADIEEAKARKNNALWDALKKHFGHQVTIAVYGDEDDPDDVCLECEDCNEVILDADIYTLCVREGFEE